MVQPNTESLCRILGGLKNRLNNMWLQLKKEVGTRNPGKFLWTEKLFKDQWTSALIFIEAKHKCKRLHDEYTATTGEGNKPIPPAQQIRQRRARQYEGLDEYNFRVGPRTGWRFYPSSTTTPSSSSSHWEQHDDWKSNKSWGSRRTSSWTEQ